MRAVARFEPQCLLVVPEREIRDPGGRVCRARPRDGSRRSEASPVSRAHSPALDRATRSLPQADRRPRIRLKRAKLANVVRQALRLGSGLRRLTGTSKLVEGSPGLTNRVENDRPRAAQPDTTVSNVTPSTAVLTRREKYAEAIMLF